MTTNKPEVVAYHHINKENPEHRGVSLHHDASCTSTLISTEPLILLSDYEALQAVCEELRTVLDAHKAARIAYASEFPLGADGTPDVGSIHENIRLLKKDAERYRYIKKGNQWIVAATQTGVHLDGEVLDELIDSEIEQQK